MKLLKKFLCKVIGHEWTDTEYTNSRDAIYVELKCKYCGARSRVKRRAWFQR